MMHLAGKGSVDACREAAWAHLRDGSAYAKLLEMVEELKRQDYL